MGWLEAGVVVLLPTKVTRGHEGCGFAYRRWPLMAAKVGWVLISRLWFCLTQIRLRGGYAVKSGCEGVEGRWAHWPLFQLSDLSRYKRRWVRVFIELIV